MKRKVWSHIVLVKIPEALAHCILIGIGDVHFFYVGVSYV